MAKNCECDFLISTVKSHAGMAGLPLATRMVWQLLVHEMLLLSQTGLWVGSEVYNHTAIAHLIHIEQADLETHLEPLIRRNLLAWREDGALECPMLAQRMRRAETSRINGMKGGRPRKHPAGQGSFMLPIVGGAASAPAAAKTQHETSSRGRSLEEAKEEETKLTPAAEVPGENDAVIALSSDLADKAGLPRYKGLRDYPLVRKWLKLGATPDQIRAVVSEICERDTYDPKRTQHLGYFNAAMMAANAGGFQTGTAMPLDRRQGIQRFNRDYAAYIANGRKGTPPSFEGVTAA